MIITMKDVRKASLCAPGSKNFFRRAKRYYKIKNFEFDWDDFIKNGIDSEKLIKLDDAIIKQVLEAAKNGR